MPINLDPRLIAFDSKLERGALMRLEAAAARGAPTGADVNLESGTVLHFQYNPETITRTRTGKWDARKKRKGQKVGSPHELRQSPPPQQVKQRDAMGSSALLADSEQISLKIVFDATEALLAGRATPEQGILPQLAFLEVVSTGKEGKAANKQREAAQPIRPDELLLILGTQRIFPVVMTSLSITEQKFLPTLVPLRAEVDLKLNVLEPAESAYSAWVSVAFKRLFESRVNASELAIDRGDVVSAIASELNRQPFPRQNGGNP
jgi:hypothetical protein